MSISLFRAASLKRKSLGFIHQCFSITWYQTMVIGFAYRSQVSAVSGKVGTWLEVDKPLTNTLVMLTSSSSLKM